MFWRCSMLGDQTSSIFPQVENLKLTPSEHVIWSMRVQEMWRSDQSETVEVLIRHVDPSPTCDLLWSFPSFSADFKSSKCVCLGDGDGQQELLKTRFASQTFFVLQKVFALSFDLMWPRSCVPRCVGTRGSVRERLTSCRRSSGRWRSCCSAAGPRKAAPEQRWGRAALPPRAARTAPPWAGLRARARSQAGLLLLLLLWGPLGAQAVRAASGHPHRRAALRWQLSARAQEVRLLRASLHSRKLKVLCEFRRGGAGAPSSTSFLVLTLPAQSAAPLPGSFQIQKRSCSEEGAAALLLLLLSVDLLLFLRSTGLLSAAAPLVSFFLTFYLCSPSPRYVPPSKPLSGFWLA